jgi:hypothetical protein
LELTVAYHGHSGVRRRQGGLDLVLAPNLRRDRVGFAGSLRSPLRFREAVSALHDVVVSDLRYRKRDKSAYRTYLLARKEREAVLRQGAAGQARAELDANEPLPIPPGLEERFKRLRKRYWEARQQYADYLAKHDPNLWRLLMPCDPVITVAPDVLFFECFSADESSYGCLTVGRDAFQAEQDVSVGTTNVDYSWALYEQFQKLRSYRQTRFEVDPAGFEVRTEADPAHREEKIDLPDSWLRGFLQLQAAMSLPMRRVPVSREGLYDVLAWLKSHRAPRSPRALRFELTPGQPVALVLEPWEKRIVLHGTPYPGGRPEVVRTWGRDRLRVLARLLPLAEGADVYLLGTGLPSFWSVRMGEMRLLLGLSGWTANDWTGGSALDQLAPPAEVSGELLRAIGSSFVGGPAWTFAEVCRDTGQPGPVVAAGLNRLAQLGQVIHDLPAGVYRWRQIMPSSLSLAELGRDSPETEAARDLVARGCVSLQRDERSTSGLRVLAGSVSQQIPAGLGIFVPGGIPAVEAVLDGDGHMVRGKCNCSHHHQFGLRRGPCRHLQALRRVADGEQHADTLEAWFRQLWMWN